MLLSGIQDVVGVNKLGRPLHDPENFKQFKAEVDKAAEKSGIGIGREPINTSSRKGRSDHKMVMMKEELSVYGGAIVQKAIDVGVKTTDATSITPTMRNSTLGNIIMAILGGGLAYYYRGDGVKGLVSAAFSAAAVNNLIEDAAKAAGIPGATEVGSIRRVQVPFIPAFPTGPIVSPSQAAAQSGAPALF